MVVKNILSWDKANPPTRAQAMIAVGLSRKLFHPAVVCLIERHMDSLLSLNTRWRRIRVATPKWANMGAIKAIYAKCQEASRSSPNHVDHIIPITSDVVCGLHCEDNLRIIPAVDNLKKHNKFNG